MHQHETGPEAIERLKSDVRTFSPDGIERVAWGWRRHEGHTRAFHMAEQTALRAVEGANRGDAWDDVRQSLRGLMEGENSLVPWKDEHDEEGHTAERAVYGAALALVAGERLPHDDYVVLVRPLAEALPWLLPEEPPAPRGG